MQFLFRFQRFSRPLLKPPSSSNLGLHVILVSSQRKEGTKERKNKRCSFHKVMFLSWLSAEEKCQQENKKPSQRIYNHSILCSKGTASPRRPALSLRRTAAYFNHWLFTPPPPPSQPMCVFAWRSDQSYSDSDCSCGAPPCWQFLRMTGSGWASVLNTQSSSGRRSSSEKSRYRYLQTDGDNPLVPEGSVHWLVVIVPAGDLKRFDTHFWISLTTLDGKF